MKIIPCIVLLASFILLVAGSPGPATAEPGMRVLDSIKNEYGPVKFDHPKHTAIAGNCSACHHEHTMANDLPCKQCHTITPQSFKNSVSHSFMACKNCHASQDRDNPGMPGLKVAYHKQCFSCHKGMGNIGLNPKGCTEMCHSKRADRLGLVIRK